MIASDEGRQLMVSMIDEFEKALVNFDESPEAHPGVHPKLIRGQRDGLANQLDALRRELVEYDRSSHVDDAT